MQRRAAREQLAFLTIKIPRATISSFCNSKSALITTPDVTLALYCSYGKVVLSSVVVVLFDVLVARHLSTIKTSLPTTPTE